MRRPCEATRTRSVDGFGSSTTWTDLSTGGDAVGSGFWHHVLIFLASRAVSRAMGCHVAPCARRRSA
jgi:hypothetical protein